MEHLHLTYVSRLTLLQIGKYGSRIMLRHIIVLALPGIILYLHASHRPSYVRKMFYDYLTSYRVPTS